MKQYDYENFQNNYQNEEQNKRAQKKKRARTVNIIIYTVAGLLFLTAGILLFREFVFVPNQAYIDPNNIAGATFTPLGTPVSHYNMIPVKLSFINENLTCDVAPVGVDENNTMESVEAPQIASWLSVEPYVVPGDMGNAIIGGHNLWSGQAGTFSKLKNMGLGDSVAVIFNTGDVRYFEVIDTYECSFDDTSCMKPESSEPLLTLITCKGDWDSSLNTSRHRVVVVCKYVSAPAK